MKIIVLDGYSVNPGDLSWAALEECGDVTVYDRTAPCEIAARVDGADAVLTNKVVMTAVGDAEVKGMTLIVTKSEYRPVNIEMLYRGYQEPTEIVISNYRTGQKYVDSSFVFDAKKHPGVEVIDLR